MKTAFSNDCFRWFETIHSRPERGDAAETYSYLDDIKSEFRVDDTRVFVTGLSAGAGMTSNLLAIYPETFAAGAIIAGVPAGCAESVGGAFPCMNAEKNKSIQEWGDAARRLSPDNYDGKYLRVTIWHGEADQVVDVANADILADQWTNVHGISHLPSETGVQEDVSYYLSFGDGQVESWIIPGLDHAVALKECADASASYFTESTMCSTTYIAEFFELI